MNASASSPQDGFTDVHGDTEPGGENYSEYPDAKADVHEFLSSSRRISNSTGSYSMGVYIIANYSVL
jgi:hypothetical protein